MEELYTEFAYDDAFRTMAVKCDDLLLPFLNYTFGEHYDSTACIVRGCNEHLIDRGMEVNEKELPQIELDSAQADALIQEYEVMLTRLDKLVENNILSAFSRGVIIKLIKEVNEKLTNKYVNINRRVGDYMGGRVLDLDIIRAHDSGIAEGRQEGRAEGYEKRAICDIKNLMKNMKLTAEQAMEALGIDKSEFSKYMTML